MPDYRLHKTVNNQVFAPADVITADTDVEAIEKATQLMNGDSVEMELWESARRIAKLPNTGSA